jgi:hypothetical protein
METPRDTKTGCGTKPKLQEPLYFQVEVLAIPAGLEPATRGVEIRYSSRFLVFIEKPKGYVCAVDHRLTTETL